MHYKKELQGKASHEALLRLQDAEIQLLELMKKWIFARVKCERDYATAVTTMVNNARKNENTEFDTPLFKVWSCIVQETENIVQKVRENADAMCTKTLDSLVFLISEKRATKKFYLDERNRIDAENHKVHAEVDKQKAEYEKCLNKVVQDRAKYEDIKSKGKPGNKLEDSKAKYHKSSVRLHKVHNEYVTALSEASLHQDGYTGSLLPGLLDYQQKVQETLVQQCKDILLEYAQLTDATSDEFSKCYREIQKNIRNIQARTEYDSFIESHKSVPEDPKQFAFECNSLDDYKGNLVPNELALDDLTYSTLTQSQTDYEEGIQVSKRLRENKETELMAYEDSLKQLQSGVSEDKSKEIYDKQKSIWAVKREIEELRCKEHKKQVLYDTVHRILSRIGNGEVPQALDLQDISLSEANESSTSNTGKHSRFGAIGEKLGGLLSKKASDVPPGLPPLDYGADENQRKDNSLSKAPPVLPKPNKASYESCEVGSSKSDPKKPTSTRKMAQPRKLENEDWFHGVLPRDEVQRLLVNDGDFLVRESKQKKTGQMQYVLSVFWSGHKHFIIQGQEGAWQFEGPTFPNIPELVDHQLKLGTPVTNKSQAILRKAIAREEWELKNDDIEMRDKIGAGNFGDVYRGMYKPKRLEVAIKTCKETLSDDQKKKFLMEGRILKQYDHPNIVKFVGIAAHRNPVMILMEYVPGGALSTYLRKNGQRLRKKEMVKMCEDAAAGMSYLSQAGCIHRDLAARNCLVDNQRANMVKISDFGMSRQEDIYEMKQMIQIPIKWTAPEVFSFGVYTSKCDVWSFGILMWEIFSCGMTPYTKMNNKEAQDSVDRGYRMPPPPDTPSDVYNLMLKCWQAEATDRPSFLFLHKKLEEAERVLTY